MRLAPLLLAKLRQLEVEVHTYRETLEEIALVDRVRSVPPASPARPSARTSASASRDRRGPASTARRMGNVSDDDRFTAPEPGHYRITAVFGVPDHVVGLPSPWWRRIWQRMTRRG